MENSNILQHLLYEDRHKTWKAISLDISFVLPKISSLDFLLLFAFRISASSSSSSDERCYTTTTCSSKNEPTCVNIFEL